MRVLYKAEDTRLGRHVALKFLCRKIAPEPQAIERNSWRALRSGRINLQDRMRRSAPFDHEAGKLHVNE